MAVHLLHFWLCKGKQYESLTLTICEDRISLCQLKFWVLVTSSTQQICTTTDNSHHWVECCGYLYHYADLKQPRPKGKGKP